jgi:hypothetical protein
MYAVGLPMKLAAKFAPENLQVKLHATFPWCPVVFPVFEYQQDSMLDAAK